MKFNCSYCGKEGEKTTSHYNRAKKTSPNLYCSQICFGLDRRITIEEKKRKKAEYDKKLALTPERKEQEAAYFQKDYKANPEKYRQERKRRYKQHLKYLQTPKYKAWKKQYDEQYTAKKNYGDLWEIAVLLKKVEAELDSQKIKQANSVTFNKSSQQRKRKWQQLSKILLSQN